MLDDPRRVEVEAGRPIFRLRVRSKTRRGGSGVGVVW